MQRTRPVVVGEGSGKINAGLGETGCQYGFAVFRVDFIDRKPGFIGFDIDWNPELPLGTVSGGIRRLDPELHLFVRVARKDPAAM